MPRIATFAELQRHRHTLGLHCPCCNRWSEADLSALVAAGAGSRLVTTTRFRCRDCGAPADKQVRPPVPQVSGAVGYIAG